MPKVKDESIRYRILLLLIEGDKRFSDLLSDVRRATLSNELRQLEHYKLIKRSVDNKSRPPKVTYSITDKGRQTLVAKAAILIRTMEDTVALLRKTGVQVGPVATDTNDLTAKSLVNGIIANRL